MARPPTSSRLPLVVAPGPEARAKAGPVGGPWALTAAPGAAQASTPPCWTPSTLPALPSNTARVGSETWGRAPRAAAAEGPWLPAPDTPSLGPSSCRPGPGLSTGTRFSTGGGGGALAIPVAPASTGTAGERERGESHKDGSTQTGASSQVPRASSKKERERESEREREPEKEKGREREERLWVQERAGKWGTHGSFRAPGHTHTCSPTRGPARR